MNSNLENIIYSYEGNCYPLNTVINDFVEITGDEEVKGLHTDTIFQSNTLDFKLDEDSWINIEFEVIDKMKSNPIKSIIKISRVFIS